MFHGLRFLRFDLFWRRPRTIAHPAGEDISGKLHPAQFAGGLVAGQEFVDRVAHWPFVGIHFRRGARREREHQFLAFQFVARASVREPVPEGLFHPALQQRRGAVPEYRELQYDDVGFQQPLLFGLRVDFEIRVEAVEPYDLRLGQSLRNRFEDRFVGHRCRKIGMAGYYECVFHLRLVFKSFLS